MTWCAGGGGAVVDSPCRRGWANEVKAWVAKLDSEPRLCTGVGWSTWEGAFSWTGPSPRDSISSSSNSGEEGGEFLLPLHTFVCKLMPFIAKNAWHWGQGAILSWGRSAKSKLFL
jgi:hypothetical protein